MYFWRSAYAGCGAQRVGLPRNLAAATVLRQRIKDVKEAEVGEVGYVSGGETADTGSVKRVRESQIDDAAPGEPGLVDGVPDLGHDRTAFDDLPSRVFPQTTANRGCLDSTSGAGKHRRISDQKVEFHQDEIGHDDVISGGRVEHECERDLVDIAVESCARGSGARFARQRAPGSKAVPGRGLRLPGGPLCSPVVKMTETDLQ